MFSRFHAPPAMTWSGEIPRPGGPIPGGGSGALAGRELSHYRVKSLLGRGGFAEVYDGWDLDTGKNVALKVLGMGAVPPYRQQFVAAARKQMRIDHPSVCRIFDVEDDLEPPFVVMESI